MSGADLPSVLVVGAGAIGAFYGSVLARQGAPTSVVCRSDLDTVRRDGFSISSYRLGDYAFRPQRVIASAAECGSPPDYLILAVKVLEDEDRAGVIRPAVGPHTVIVLLQNGIDIEPEIVAAFPANEVLSCLAFAGVRRVGGGRIEHQTLGYLLLGRFPSGDSQAARRLGRLWEAGGISCEIVQDVVAARWRKAVWNAAFNPLSIMGGTLTTRQMLSSPIAEDLVRRLMDETRAVAAAHGHPVPAEIVDSLVDDTRAMAPYKTSMALDFEHHRAMEVEAILGNVVRAGRAAGTAIPALETIYAVTKIIEQKAREERPNIH